MIRQCAGVICLAASISWAQRPVVTQQAETLTIPRSTATKPILLPFIISQAGFDTEITLSNTSQDTLGSFPQSGTCTLYYYGSGAPSAPQTTPQIPFGQQFVFMVSQGGGGVAAAPNFVGYIIANCGFPLVRGYANVVGATILAFGQDAQVVALPRSTAKPQALLFPFVVNQSGNDTGLAIANTSADPFGTGANAGTCSLKFYGDNAPSSTFVTPTIAAGSVYLNLASTLAPGFQGYLIANCNFSNAATVAFVADTGARAIAGTEVAQLLTLPRPTATQPLLFSSVTNQNGNDTGIAIANSSVDPFGTTPSAGSCTMNFYGANAPAPISTGPIAAGAVYTNLVSQLAPGFSGYVAASCFPQARGWSFTSNAAGFVPGSTFRLGWRFQYGRAGDIAKKHIAILAPIFRRV